MEELKLAMEDQKRVLEKVAFPSYAEAAAAGTRNGTPEVRPTLHSVVVTSTIETETGEQVMNKVRKELDAKEGWINVERVRKGKNRKVILAFGSEEDRQRASDRLSKEGTSLSVEKVANRDPMVIFRDVLAVNTDGFILEALKKQNGDVFRGLGEGENRMTIAYRSKARNPHNMNLVVRTSPIIWQRLTTRGSAYIDLQRVRVHDQSPLVQCSRCLGFGHSKKHCTGTVDLCSHCGGPSLKTECTNWKTGADDPCSLNCKKDGLFETGHNAFSRDCPANLQRKRLATAELLMEASKRGINVALIQEPYIGSSGVLRGQRGVRVFQDTSLGKGVVKAAIAVFDDDLVVTQYPDLTTKNIVVVGIQTVAWSITLVSVYFEPDTAIEPYLRQVVNICAVAGSKSLIVGGDASAKNIWWGSPVTDRRGECLNDTIGQLGLHVLNSGDVPTFDVIRGGRRLTSFVDVTLCSEDLLGKVEDWRVDGNLVTSDHNGIVFLRSADPEAGGR